MIKRVFVFFVLVLFTATLAVQAQDSTPPAPRPLIVFAAASLSDAFEDVARAFETEYPGADVIFNFAGSSDLAAQIAEGAPADVFASANARQMNAAIESGRIAGEPVAFVQNRLVLIVPADNPAGITGVADLANEGLALVIAAPDVPVRDYTDVMLEQLAADPAYGDVFREAVYANVVSEEQNVRQVAAKVALGEADAGIVYSSDVTPTLRDQVIAFSIDDAINTIASYPAAALNDSRDPELASAFVNFLLSDNGQTILASWGFIRVCGESVTESEATPETAATAESTAETPTCSYVSSVTS